ncbi:MAG: SusC/RagA family TonB-linked outer membrane protein, partial [Marinoscillum sp.]
MKKYLLLGLSLILSASLWAQERTVSGTVTDSETGESVPGANVVVKGTTNGTITDFDGKYQISVGSDATLVFTFVGYSAKEVAVGNRSVIDVGLDLDVEELSEVVVVGYGSQQKKEITSSVVALDEKEFNKGNINDPTQLLQGKVPGLSVYNKGGDPNSTSTIRLRGISTVGANAEPLVVIDGVIGASLQNVDPNDIASINVLKDGSAAAIYGSRGSSGVILVTTKQGKRGGGVTANYNGYVAAATILNEQPVMNADEYLAAGGNDLGAKTDWQDEVTRTGVSNVHNVAISGGSENTTFRLSTNFRDINGILRESGFDQINARANINHYALNDKLKINFNMSLTNRESNYSFNEALRYATLYNPTAPVNFDNGDYFQAILFDNFNPVAILEQNQNVGKKKELNFNLLAEYSITDALSITANYGQQYDNQLNGEFYPSTSFFRGLNRNGLARRYTEDGRFSLFETYGTYSGSFGSLDLTLSAGYSYQESFREALLLELGNLPTDALGFYGIDLSGDRVLGVASNVNVDSWATPNEKIIAFFGRANITFDDAIFFNASLRREGSTKLGVDNQWGIFPSLGAGIDLNKYLSLTGVDVLKFRVGYGVTGALPPASGYAKAGVNYDFSGNGQFVQVRRENPDLKWEEKTEINVGVDFGLQGRLTGSLDLYTRNVTDFLQLFTPSSSSGEVSDPFWNNIGSLTTNGAEIALNYDAFEGADFSWNTGIVASTYKSTLDEFIIDIPSMRGNLGAPGQNSTNMIRVAPGAEIGQIWGPVFESVDENGAPVMKDLNGDGQLITDQGSALADDGDFEVLGKGLPTLEIGWTNQLTYKKWDFNAFFRGAFGHSLINTYRAFYEPIDPGAINSYNRIKSDKAVDNLTVSQFSSLYVEKADFFKLDNVTVGYNFDMSNSSAFRT